jgi:hypothetical protein
LAGTLFGLGLSQQVSSSGSPLAGCLLYIYQENSSTPVTTYSDYTLTTEQTFPIEADSAGRLPQIWVADGSYRARLTTSAGVEVFDEASVTAIGASSTTVTSGGSSSSATGFETGDPIWVPVSGARSGWVRCNGRTIGSGSSSATERANSDTQALFEYLWNNFSNTLCAVGGGRGANAQADFNANKAITTLDMRGRGAFGLDDMGNTAASVLVGDTPTSAAASLGAETTSIQLTATHLPIHSHTSGTIEVASLAITNGSNVVRTLSNDDFGTFSAASGGNDVFDDVTGADQSTLTLTSGATTGATADAGSGTAYVATTISPGRLGTWYMKL